MSRRKKVAEEEVNTEAWLATYCDAITLLLTFFILLYSTASVDNEKYYNISNALRGQFTGESILDGDSGGNSIIDDFTETNKDDELREKLENMIEDNNIGEHVDLRKDSRGILLEFKNSILFDSGKYTLKQEGVNILQSVYGLIKDVKNPIIVEGHTDDIKNSEELSNWELSTLRATDVVRYFVEDKGMDPALFSATGYGEYKPIAANDSVENRAKNRRVEILIKTAQGESK